MIEKNKGGGGGGLGISKEGGAQEFVRNYKEFVSLLNKFDIKKFLT